MWISWTIKCLILLIHGATMGVLSILLLQLIFRTISVILMTTLRKCWLRNIFHLCRFNFVHCNWPKKTHVNLNTRRNLCFGFDLPYLHTSSRYRSIRVVTFIPKGVAHSLRAVIGRPANTFAWKRNFSTTQRKKIREQTFSTTNTFEKTFRLTKPDDN